MTADPLPAPPPGSTPATTTPFTEDAVPGARRRRALAAGAVAVVALLIGVAAFAGVSAASSGAAGYRTAAVSTQDVERTLAAVGTIEPVAQAAVAFPVSGTVATVEVTTGSTVEAGQVLATLDGTELQRAVNTQQAAVDQAGLTLQKVLSGESAGTGSSTGSSSGASGGSGSTSTRTSGSATTSTSSSGPNSGGSGSSSGSTSTSVDQAALTAARTAVAAAQHTLDVDMAAAVGALSTATTACSGDSSPTTSSSTTSSSTTSSSTSSTPTTVPATNGSAACQQALAAALAAQQTVATDEKALQDAVTALDHLLSAATTSTGESGTTSSASSPGTMGSSTASTGSTGSSGSGSTSSVSSADIVAAQKAVDAADAQLAVAQQALAQATIVSPIAGTVTAVRLTIGESVSAGSSTATILVAGPGGYEVTTSIAVTDLPHVAVGQSATVVPDGSTEVRPAKVVQIGLVASTSTSGTTTTYPVVLALHDPTTALPDGGLASVHIVTGATAGVTVVPTSAVTTTATGRTVVVLDGGKPETVAVQVGTVGGTWTEITSGVDVGQTVVLADLSLALPGSATSGSSTSGSTGSARTTTGSGATAGAGGFTPPAGITPPGG